MAKKQGSGSSALSRLLHFVAWLTGVIVSLAVAFGMIDKTLTLAKLSIPLSVTVFFGWVVVVTTLLGVVLAIVKHIK